MAFTQEQLEAILAMGDIGGAESEMANQMALADKLRATYARTPGRDVGSNIARAAGGIAGAVGAYKGQQMQPGITDMKRKLLSDMLRKRETMGSYMRERAGGGLPYDDDQEF